MLSTQITNILAWEQTHQKSAQQCATEEHHPPIASLQFDPCREWWWCTQMYSADYWNWPFSGDGILWNRCWRLLCHSLESSWRKQRGQGTIICHVLRKARCLRNCNLTVFVSVIWGTGTESLLNLFSTQRTWEITISVSSKPWMIFILCSHICPMKPVDISIIFWTIQDIQVRWWCTLALPVKSVIPCCKPWHQIVAHLARTPGGNGEFLLICGKKNIYQISKKNSWLNSQITNLESNSMYTLLNKKTT